MHGYPSHHPAYARARFPTRNPLDTSGYPKTFTGLGAMLGAMVGAIPGVLADSGAIREIGFIVGGAVGGYMLAPPDRKTRGAIGGAIGGIFTPVGALIGGAIGGRKPDGT